MKIIVTRADDDIKEKMKERIAELKSNKNKVTQQDYVLNLILKDLENSDSIETNENEINREKEKKIIRKSTRKGE